MLGSQSQQSTAFLSVTNDVPSDWLQPTENNKSKAKKKSMERISKLFHKKSKKQTASLNSSYSTLSLSLSETTRSGSTQFESKGSGLTGRSNSLRVSATQVDSVPEQESTQDNEQEKCETEVVDKSNTQDVKSESHDDVEDNDGNHGESRPVLNCQAEQTELTRKSSLCSTHSSAADVPCATTATLLAELTRQQQVLDNLKLQGEQYQHDNQVLQEQLDRLNAKKEQRCKDLNQLKANYNNHIKAMRATDDNVESITLKIRHLKHMISELAAALVKDGQDETATAALSKFWLNLHDTITRMGNPLSPEKLQLLTEKFMMDVLIQNLNLNTFPGLDRVEQYNQLQDWLDEQETDPAFSIRLRQEVALIVAREEGNKGSCIAQSRLQALQNSWKYLYSGIVKAYPFVYQHDKAEPDVLKHYGAKVQILVEQAISLGLAIKGQEYDLTAAPVREGEQQFDPDLMVDEGQQTSGIVDLCICPPFVVANTSPPQVLEKGRVLCSTLPPYTPNKST